MKMLKGGTQVLLYESFGFGFLLVLAWAGDFLNLFPFFGNPGVQHQHWRSDLAESLFIVLVWALVFLLTRRVLRRLPQGEGLMRICAWCRKVGYRNTWITVEDYFAQGFHAGTTHGICPDCLNKVAEDTRRFHKTETEAQQEPGDPAGGDQSAAA
jgi:hypothetical protein